ncbi:YkvA family protein [Peptostreptococcus anaerobius]|uniref:YkvA family protein n=1 Tax=Peptostreptococcus anaerobius TaxID=1261 RepID=UPI00254FA19B|nr:YkvA family protein [Peptostreptococcus anaerobius]MDK8278334.1 YkvA family protein [Peptostreptococcus anaerobius]
MQPEIITDKKAEKQLKKGYEEAQKILNDEDSMEKFLQSLEKKLKMIPVVGDKLSVVPVMASLVRSYVNKEYTDIPVGSILAIVSALIYFVSPVDLMPDSIPGIGYLDDAAIITTCWKLVESDVDEYQMWRQVNHKIID